MRKEILIILTLLILNLISCDSGLSDKEIEERATNITEVLTEKNIDIFKKWNFTLRGVEIWTKQKNDSIIFQCFYSNKQDSVSFIVFDRHLYSNEFKCSYKIDTSLFQRIEFKKSIDNKIKIIGLGRGKPQIIAKDVDISKVFYERNPYILIGALSKIKNRLNVAGISYYPRMGNFIQFYISNQALLTYIYDYSSYNDIWVKRFSNEKQIKKDWYLKIYEKPKDMN